VRQEPFGQHCINCSRDIESEGEVNDVSREVPLEKTKKRNATGRSQHGHKKQLEAPSEAIDSIAP
jgi:hypothetical protein